MREGWTTKPISEIIIRSGTIDPRKKPDEFFNYIDVSSISNKTFEITDTSELLGKDAPSRARRLTESGDVLFATIRPTLRRIAIVPDYLDGAVCSTGYFVFRTKQELDGKFLFYQLFTDEFMGAMESHQSGASYPAVNDTQVKQQKISYPPLPEQKRIVAILDEAFAGIDAAIANTEKNLANAREIFESYLNDVFTKKGEGWEEKTLGDLCDVRDGTHDSPKYVDEGIPFVTQKNIREDGLSFEKTKFISDADHTNFYRRSNVANGDILISMIGVNRGMACLVDDPRVFSIKNVGLVKSSENLHMSFLLHYLKSNVAKRYVESESRGGAQPFIGLGKLRSFPVAIAPKNLQSIIVKSLDGLHEEVNDLETTYQQKLDSLNELKQSILAKAFSGELTADSDEILKEAVG